MSPKWTTSAHKHQVPIPEQVFAIVHATYIRTLEIPNDTRQGQVTLYIGPPHGQTTRELEILVRHYPNTARESDIFHAMPLTSKFANYRIEHPDD